MDHPTPFTMTPSPKTFLRLAVIAILPCISSCTLLSNLTKPKKTESPEIKKSETRLVGRIASISSQQNFVLIQSYGTWNVATGTILASRGTDGRTANLRVTGEKLGQFAAADIQSGTTQTGDAVFTTISPITNTTNTPEPADQSSPES